jgi:phosphoribosylformylglycinamidine cyclo-ligase
MPPTKTLSYKDSGVDINANARWINRIQSAMNATHGPQVLSQPGAFAGLFDISKSTPKNPVLVGCADGVGTKVILGVQTGQITGLGVDLVAMNVNDLITCGAKPLFFLDYLAVNTLDPDALLAIIQGVAEGCKQAACALLGGETAEMPDLYKKGDFDLAGFSVGIVDRDKIIDGTTAAPGDILLALPSSGLHANGFSLVRRVIKSARLKLDKTYDELGETLTDAVMRPTRIYVKPALAAINAYKSKPAVAAMAHITGGGLEENIARAIPKNCDAMIDTQSWTPPPIFNLLQKSGVDRSEMFRVFNMGVGFTFIVKEQNLNRVTTALEEQNQSPFTLGRLKRGKRKVILK